MTTTQQTDATATTEQGGPPLLMARRALGGLLAGLAGGVGMLVTLVAFAVGQGRGVGYPLHAVQALMSGARVLPDHPRRSLYDPHVADAVVGPFYFFLPALAVGILSAWWVGRRVARGGEERWPGAAVLPALTLTVAFFVVFVLVVGLREASPAVQRGSSGFGVRELGLAAWVTGHAAYLLLLVLLLGPLSRFSAMLGRRGQARELRGEDDAAS